MSRVPALIITGPGTNRDKDVAAALDLAGADARIVLANELVATPRYLDDARLAVVAGGFSYADSLGAGRMLALDLTLGLGEVMNYPGGIAGDIEPLLDGPNPGQQHLQVHRFFKEVLGPELHGLGGELVHDGVVHFVLVGAVGDAHDARRRLRCP